MTPEEFLATENIAYSDWFGSGSTHGDYNDTINAYGTPQNVLRHGCMLALVYTDKIVVAGYDGGEYFHEFVFSDQKGA